MYDDASAKFIKSRLCERQPCRRSLLQSGSSDRLDTGKIWLASQHKTRTGLRAVLFGLLFLGPLARAPMSAFWVGARLGPRKLASPASSGVGVGNMHNLPSHIIAQDTFLIQKT